MTQAMTNIGEIQRSFVHCFDEVRKSFLDILRAFSVGLFRYPGEKFIIILHSDKKVCVPEAEAQLVSAIPLCSILFERMSYSRDRLIIALLASFDSMPLPVLLDLTHFGLVIVDELSQKIGLPDTLDDRALNQGMEFCFEFTLSVFFEDDVGSLLAPYIISPFGSHHAERVLRLAIENDFFPEQLSNVIHRLQDEEKRSVDFHHPTDGICLLDPGDESIVRGFLFFHLTDSYSRLYFPIDPDVPALYISFLFVEPTIQRFGVGQKLVANVIARAHERFRNSPLRVVVSSKKTPKAIRFWFGRLQFEMTSGSEDDDAFVQKAVADLTAATKFQSTTPTRPEDADKTDSEVVTDRSPDQEVDKVGTIDGERGYLPLINPTNVVELEFSVLVSDAQLEGY
eukprot:GILK01009588.1.p1 GENE.GILK01009588.1~~GILK01009588.1.p1  ORF type:complete len:397 (-),score=47.45 GILK01009588.1:550-1740(-)